MKFYKLVVILLMFASIFVFQTVNAKIFDTYSHNITFYNASEDKIMYEKNSNEKAHIASLTKLMTALIIIENVNNFDEKINFKNVDYKFLIKKDLSLSSLNHEKSYTYNDLLYDFVMESSADCGYALALAIGGTEENFVKLMNMKAKELGMNNSSFANPVGLDDENNYSTTNDMLILMKAVLKNERLKNIISTFRYITEDDTEVYHTMYYYTNHFKLNMPYLKGGKTGFEEVPGFALASYAVKDGVEYILITTNSNPGSSKPLHFLDAKQIYEYYFKNYGYQVLYNKGDILKTFKTNGLGEKTIAIKTNKAITSYLNSNYNKNDIETTYEGKNSINILNYKGQKLGTLNVYYQDKLIEKIPIHLNEKIKFNLRNFIHQNKIVLLIILGSLLVVLSAILTYSIINKKCNQ